MNSLIFRPLLNQSITSFFGSMLLKSNEKYKFILQVRYYIFVCYYGLVFGSPL